MMYIVYVLISLSVDKTYVGYTADLERRMVEHNHSGEGFTKRYRPWEILFTETYATKQEAMKREQYFKTGKGREEIKSRRFSA
jgi:putative endonuclease